MERPGVWPVDRRSLAGGFAADFRAILQIRSVEFRWALIAMVGVLLLGTLKGILVAVLVSMVSLAIRGSLHPLLVLGRKPGTNVFRARSPEHPQDETFPGLLLVQPEGAIHFANAQRLGQQLRAVINEFNPRVVVIYMRAVHELEYTALRMLADGEEQLRENGIELWLVGMNPGVLKVIKLSPLGERLGHGRMFFTMEQAVERYQQLTG
jgi:anti-anti-sigma factor